MARAWAVLTRPSAMAAASTVVLVECLGEAEVGAGVAAYLAGLDRHPVGCGPGPGLGGGTREFGLCQQVQLQSVELRLGLGQGGQGLALL